MKEKKTITISVPTDWKAVTLRQYLKLQADLKTYGDTDEGYLAALLDNLCEFPPQYLYGLEVGALRKIQADITNFMNNTELPLQKFIQVDGREYGFEPNLANMAYGAYLDITKWDTIQMDENWAKIMSILYRPVLHKTSGLYERHSYAGWIDEEKFLDVTMDVHWGCLFFFVRTLVDSLSAIQNSLMEMPEVAPSIKSILATNGKTTPLSSYSQEEISAILMKSLSNH
jgi:hypothetical protein